MQPERPRTAPVLNLERLGLSAVANRHPLDLDAGSRRLGAVAAAIAHAPDLLVLDEAQRGLDRNAIDRLETVMAEERARGCSLMLACHDMDFVGRNADLIVHVANTAVATGTVTDFFDPASRPDGMVAPELHDLARCCGYQIRRTTRDFVDDILNRRPR